MAKKGRPTKYTHGLAEEICEAIASSPHGLSILCSQNSHWPDRTNIFIWLRKYPDFRDKYTQCKQQQGEVFIDYIQELMAEEHKYEDELGNERIDVGMLRLKIDTIKWQAGKLLPKQYGALVDEKKSVSESIVEKLIDRLIE